MRGGATKIHTLHTDLWLPRAIDEVFAFFADAGNLDAITPPWLGFRIDTPTPIAMGVGARIDYRLRLHGIPVRWRTEITAWQPPFSFVDEQRRGPYRRWVHRHTFAEQDGGTRVQDDVEYVVPGFVCAPLLQRFLVGPDLRAIFTYRQQQIRALLAPGVAGPEPVVVLGRG